MKKITLVFVLFSFCTIAYNQIIKGTIQDQTTKRPINFATVYFNGTFVGTYSDQNGNFEIDISKNKSMPLVVSALGYYSATVSDLSSNKYFRIYLKPKIFELNEVIISAKGSSRVKRERRENLKYFRDVFIGTTSNAQKCEITNEDDIIFKYKSFGDTITASSLKPLLIENNALGYKIYFYLDEFKLLKRQKLFSYSGNIIFLDDLAILGEYTKRFERRREDAFLGSRMHFFRTLWENKLDSSGYSVIDKYSNKLNCDDLIIQADSLTKYLKNKGPMTISYSANASKTFITLSKDSVYFNESGNFDGLGIIWEGEMAVQRIADQLPYEYSYRKISADTH
jgi:hypothetical protein